MSIILKRPSSIDDNISLERRVSALERAMRTVEGGQIVDDAIDSNHISELSIQTQHLVADFAVIDFIQAGDIQAIHIESDSIESRHIDAGQILAEHILAGEIDTQHLRADAVTAIKIEAGSINADHIQAGEINGTHIQDGVIEGVKLAEGTVTAREVSAGFLDARTSSLSYIEAEAIKGGELTLGGVVKYETGFESNNGDIVYPWWLIGDTIEADTPILDAVDPRKYTVDWTQNELLVTLEPNTSYQAGDKIAFLYDRKSSNRITEWDFNIELAIPANFVVEMIDELGDVVDGHDYTGPITYGTAGHHETKVLPIPTSGVGFQIRCTSNTTTSASPPTFNINYAQFKFEKGYGNLRILDENNNLRASMGTDEIRYNKLNGLDVEPSFIANEDGVWVPSDGFTIGSNRINGVEYNLRDFTGNLVINPRFEVLRNVPDPSDVNHLTQIPRDWLYIYDDSVDWQIDETYFETNDILPQNQSLVSGKVLQMHLQTGWDSDHILSAISHKRYIEPKENVLVLPLSISSYFRITGPAKNNIKVRMQVFSSSSPSDIETQANLSDDTLLGEVELDGSVIINETVDGKVRFERLNHSYSMATGVAGDKMSVENPEGLYVYVVLSAWNNTGTLAADHYVEWDDVDCVVSEINTPSDSQTEAELARRIAKTEFMISNMMARTKAILPDLNDGTFGLEMTAVS